MQINFLALLAAAFSTLVIGFIWYTPKVFGNAWMRETGLTAEHFKGVNKVKIFGLTIFFSFFIAMVLQFMVVHQFSIIELVGGDPSIAKPSYEAFMADYGDAFRTFRHGALHGFMTGLLLALPIIIINGMFEGKSWKYILITGGYWVVNFTVMGGIICAWV